MFNNLVLKIIYVNILNSNNNHIPFYVDLQSMYFFKLGSTYLQCYQPKLGAKITKRDFVFFLMFNGV